MLYDSPMIDYRIADSYAADNFSKDYAAYSS